MPISVFPQEATIAEGELLVVHATVDEVMNGIYVPASWESSDTTVATVTVIDDEGAEQRAHVIGVGKGGATITATVNGYSDTCEVTVEEREVVEFEAMAILDKNFSPITSIPNTDVMELTISKELGGSHNLDFSMPYGAPDAGEIKTGRYIECEGQRYFLEKISKVRQRDGNPILRVSATHIFFEMENLKVWWAVSRRDTLIGFLDELLTPFQITVTGIDTGSSTYDVTRYVEYSRGDRVMDCIKAIFAPWAATYMFDNLKLIIVPEVGSLPDSGVEFNYAETNESVEREADYSNIITHLYGLGETPEGEEHPVQHLAIAPQEILDKYRSIKQSMVRFSGVMYQSTIEWVAERYLSFHMHPFVNYRLSVAELKNISNIDELFPEREFKIDIGLEVTVHDEDLGIDIKTVIQRYRFRPLEPDHLSSVELGDFKPWDVTFTRPRDMEGDDEGSTTDPEEVEDDLAVPLYGIISTEDPDDDLGKEDYLWIKYKE